MRTIELTRNEGEDLVDLLEGCDPSKFGTWRFDLASTIRSKFGMITLAEEKPEVNIQLQNWKVRHRIP